MAINITKIVQISKGSGFGDGEWQEDMRKLGNYNMKYIVSVTIVCSLLTVMVVLSGCSNTKFDGFDPTTTTVRWIMTELNKNEN